MPNCVAISFKRLMVKALRLACQHQNSLILTAPNPLAMFGKYLTQRSSDRELQLYLTAVDGAEQHVAICQSAQAGKERN